MPQETKKTKQAYGLWHSPITAASLGAAIRLSDVQWDGQGGLVWLQSESGSSAIYRKNREDAPQRLTSDQEIRGGVGYGGGEFACSDDFIVFADKSGALYRKDFGYGKPRAITPAIGKAASPAVSPNGKWVVFVQTDGHNDLLAIVDSKGGQWPQKLVQGSDFYMQPVWSPDGSQLAWVEWDHPNMPWDGTRLCVGKVEFPDLQTPRITEIEIIAGDERHHAVQPQFSPDGKMLSFIIECDEWESLMLFDLEEQETRELVTGDGFELSQPAWVQGNHEYGWHPDGQRISYLQYQDGFASLWQVDVESGQKTQIEISPYSYLYQLAVSPISGEAACIASGPQVPSRIVTFNGNIQKIIQRSSAEMLPPQYLPTPKSISWERDGLDVKALYFAPANPNFRADGAPPVILQIHGGPTSQQVVRYHAMAAYFTSRGYGWVELNYRGSTGYGRKYREALRGVWGKTDVEDAVDCAKALVEQGLADAGKIIIMGGSAGGYTVLNALVNHPGVFAAGVDKYGVSDLFALAQETHKFELHYTDLLVGVLPDDAQKFRDWSPLNHAEQIKDPVAVFQGEEDVVVPPNQSEMIVKALQANGVPHIYVTYPGEGHGFRKAESIEDHLKQTDRFIQKYVLFK